MRVPAIIHSLGMFIANVGLFIYRFIEMTTWKISRILVKIFYILGHYAMQYLVNSHLSQYEGRQGDRLQDKMI